VQNRICLTSDGGLAVFQRFTPTIVSERGTFDVRVRIVTHGVTKHIHCVDRAVVDEADVLLGLREPGDRGAARRQRRHRRGTAGARDEQNVHSRRDMVLAARRSTNRRRAPTDRAYAYSLTRCTVHE